MQPGLLVIDNALSLNRGQSASSHNLCAAFTIAHRGKIEARCLPPINGWLMKQYDRCIIDVPSVLPPCSFCNQFVADFQISARHAAFVMASVSTVVTVHGALITAAFKRAVSRGLHLTNRCLELPAENGNVKGDWVGAYHVDGIYLSFIY